MDSAFSHQLMFLLYMTAVRYCSNVTSHSLTLAKCKSAIIQALAIDFLASVRRSVPYIDMPINQIVLCIFQMLTIRIKNMKPQYKYELVLQTLKL